jgi:SAM-dependent methyltransferase
LDNSINRGVPALVETAEDRLAAVMSRHGAERWLAAATIFLGAFLLFQIQPILAKLVLPWYGGSAAVWAACILFFQAALFLGYVYAHWLTRSFSPRQQGVIHGVLLGVSLLTLPVVPGAEWKPGGGEDPLLGILSLLTVCVGLPHFLLAATSPLVQAWLVRSTPWKLPYRFYALSNLASLGALLAYPVVVDPLLETQRQALYWSCGYILYAMVCGVMAVKSAGPRGGEPSQRDEAEVEERPGRRRQLSWVVLAALPSLLSLAVTNHLTQNVAAIPLLWIVPLAIYLLTLILCFDGDGWYRRAVFLPLNALALSGAGYVLLRPELDTSLRLQLPLFSAALFVYCMFLHGELVRRKPSGRYLTQFYLMMALGGALGGVSVGLGAPYLLRGYYELPIGLAACAMTALFLEYRQSWTRDMLWAVVAVWSVVVASSSISAAEREAKVVDRNFYGGLRVFDKPARGSTPAHRALVHGTITHGNQFADIKMRREPTAYYARGTGVDLALREFQGPSARIGVIGLGVGTLAAYGRTGDIYRFYEINPRVNELARGEFFYLRDSAARTETVLGDGRLSLEREPPQQFDVLVVDAFSGDSIPVHLLSLEAFRLYFRHLKPEGVLALHVSNIVLDLRPVAATAARELAKGVVAVGNQADEQKLRFPAIWMLVADKEQIESRPALKAAASPIPPKPGFVAWNDRYSNLLGVLR